MCASVKHWLYSTLVFASGLFVGVDQVQPLHNANRQLPWETAGFPKSQQLADLTLAGRSRRFCPSNGVGLSPYLWRHRSVPLSKKTTCNGSTSIMSGEMSQAYTTIKTEKQREENLMGLLRARTGKASPLPRVQSTGMLHH